MKRLTLKKTLGLVISICAGANISYSCTTVFANNKGPKKVVARTMDLYVFDAPKIVVYPRGMKRNGEAGPHSLNWTSKYGNVVVTEFDTNAASDGINEKGLSVHLLYLTETNYEQPDNTLPQVSNVLWGQYLLDNYTTVSEVLSDPHKYQLVATKVHGRTWPIHMAIEDASGDSAVIEFIDGKMNVYHGAQYNIMTNEPAYNIQLANLKRYASFGGQLPLPGDTDPLSRFVRVSTFLNTLPQSKDTRDSVANVLSVIRTAMVPFGAIDTSGNKTEDAWPTRWASVADLTDKMYYFNSTTTPNIIWLDLNALNFKQGAPTLFIDPNNIDLVGDVSKQLKKQLVP